DGDPLAVSTAAGTITLPALLTEMPDHVVWLPTNSVGSAVRDALHADSGAVVRIARGSATLAPAGETGTGTQATGRQSTGTEATGTQATAGLATETAQDGSVDA